MAEARQAAAGGGEEAATRHKPEYMRKEVAKAAEVRASADKTQQPDTTHITRKLPR